uniref:non-specific serine/threonine protein kinase n=1 Tax=Oryza barthii TaxID=65489 RepID=A0A0D3EM82_9ORYZ
MVAAADGADQFTYLGFIGSNLTVNGCPTITPDGLLRLTDDSLVQKGHAFHPAPLCLRNSTGGTIRSFSVTFVFGIISLFLDLSSQGMAFLIAPTNNNLSAALPAKFLGLTNDQNNGNASNHLFVVELATIVNIESGDPDRNHVGIDINGLKSVQSYAAGYYDDKSGNFQSLSLSSRQAMRVRIDYHAEKKQIDVTLAPLTMARPVKPLLSTTCDLSMVLTDIVYLGFSSATSTIYSQHYVLGWSFAVDKPAPAINIDNLPKLKIAYAGPKPLRKVLYIVLPVVTTMVVLVIGGIIIMLVRRLRYAELREDWEVEFGPHRFSYKDLCLATDGFADKHLLGVGGFGKVYKGVLPTLKLEVAVKKVSHKSRQGMKEFVAEIVSIGRLRHRNIVQLLGYCRRKGELLLVYDYIPNGSLDKFLHKNKESKHALSWTQRFRIIKGIASGLQYLHEKWEKVVVHRDIKASNILLDKAMNGQIGDFGLARLYDHGMDLETTHVAGTIGYLAPELIRTGKASPLTDVFAFGIFLLEITCGQKPIMNNHACGSQIPLVHWVLENWRDGTLMETMDARLQGEYDAGEAALVLKLGLLCSHPFPSARPRMAQVMCCLDGVAPLLDLTPANLSLAMTWDSAFDASVAPDPVTSFGTISTFSGGR